MFYGPGVKIPTTKDRPKRMKIHKIRKIHKIHEIHEILETYLIFVTNATSIFV